MENNSNPYVRFAIGLLAVAIAIHIAWQLVRPALPFLAGVIVLVLLVRLYLWYRDRY